MRKEGLGHNETRFSDRSRPEAGFLYSGKMGGATGEKFGFTVPVFPLVGKEGEWKWSIELLLP